MLAFFATLSLRLKLVAIAVATTAVAIGYFFLRWKLAASKAHTEEDKRKALEAARNTEVKIAAKLSKLHAKQAKIREELATRKDRDAFQDQGWGP